MAGQRFELNPSCTSLPNDTACVVRLGRGGGEAVGRGQLEGSGWRGFDSHAAECHKLPFTDALHQRHQVIWFYSKFLNVELSYAKQLRGRVRVRLGREAYRWEGHDMVLPT